MPKPIRGKWAKRAAVPGRPRGWRFAATRWPPRGHLNGDGDADVIATAADRGAQRVFWLAALVLALLAALGGCATGPTVYQRAYDHCRQNGGQDYECDRFARDEAAHAQQQIADQQEPPGSVGTQARVDDTGAASGWSACHLVSP